MLRDNLGSCLGMSHIAGSDNLNIAWLKVGQPLACLVRLDPPQWSHFPQFVVFIAVDSFHIFFIPAMPD
jgi:hypothetical protein